MSVAKGQLDADGQPVGRHREASLLKGGDRRLDCLGVDRKVDISVLSCLCPDKGVDPPASGQTWISADRLECVQDFMNIGNRHRHDQVSSRPERNHRRVPAFGDALRRRGGAAFEDIADSAPLDGRVRMLFHRIVVVSSDDEGTMAWPVVSHRISSGSNGSMQPPTPTPRGHR